MVWQKLLGINLTPQKTTALLKSKDGKIYTMEITFMPVEIGDIFFSWKENKIVYAKINFDMNELLSTCTGFEPKT